MALVKCPPFCRHKCTVKHHPLLVAVLNCRDTPQSGIMKQRITDLEQVVNRYMKSGWSLHEDVPDPLEEYQHPIGHWAACMGRTRALEWIVKKGFPQKSRTKQDQSTALHRALSCLQETCPAPRRTINVFRTLLGILSDALLVPNDMGNTPLHTCCCMLYNSMPRLEFYTDCIIQILEFAASHSDKWLLSQVLAAQNNDGDTPLHILAQTDRHISVMQRLVEANADLNITNLENHTPFQVAVKANQYCTTSFLKQMQERENNNPLPSIKDALGRATRSKRSKKRKQEDDDNNTEGTAVASPSCDTTSSSGTRTPPDLGRGIIEQAAQAAMVVPVANSPADMSVSDSSRSTPSLAKSSSALHTPVSVGQQSPNIHMHDDQRVLFDNFTEILRPEAVQTGAGIESLNPSVETLVTLPTEGFPVSSSGALTRPQVPTPMPSIGSPDPLSLGALTPSGSENESSGLSRTEPDSSQWDAFDNDIHAISVPNKAGGCTPIPLASQGDAFVNFLRCCDPVTRQIIRESIVRESQECTASLDQAKTNVSKLGNNLTSLQVQQAELVSTVKALLERLEKLQAEEDALNKDITAKTQELNNAHATQQGLEQRMHHCQAALDALNGLY